MKNNTQKTNVYTSALDAGRGRERYGLIRARPRFYETEGAPPAEWVGEASATPTPPGVAVQLYPAEWDYPTHARKL